MLCQHIVTGLISQRPAHSVFNFSVREDDKAAPEKTPPAFTIFWAPNNRRKYLSPTLFGRATEPDDVSHQTMGGAAKH